MKRKLIVDGQLFQTPAWHRGMGKYSLELLIALMAVGADRGWDAVEVVLSKHATADSEIIESLKRKLPAANIIMLDLMPNEIGNAKVAPRNRKVIDAHVNKELEAKFKVDFLILSLMQGEIYPTFPSSNSVSKLLLFYDLIPLMFHEVYLQSPITRVEYLTKIDELLRADTYYAISKTVANDLAIYLGIDKKRVISIDGGPINHSKASKVLNIPEPFILMPTGNDLRKNNRRAILGFKEFNQTQNNKYTLVITSFFKKQEIARLDVLCSQVVFTGNISGEELDYLYEKAEGILFPPEYEGLGLPILEALEKDKPVACSDIAVFREMSETAFHYFNPSSIVEISVALRQMVKHKAVNKKAYRHIQDRYTWQKTVEKLLAALPKQQKAKTIPESPKLDIFCPDPRDNLVGKTVQACHTELCRRFELRYFVEPKRLPGEDRINYLPYITESTALYPGINYSIKGIPVYHLGNAESYSSILVIALAVPGIVILHDSSLQKLWENAVKQGLMHQSRLDAERKIEGHKEPQLFLTSLVANNLACMVFDADSEEHLRQLAKKVNPSLLIARTEIPMSELAYGTALPRKTTSFTYLPDPPEANESKHKLTDFRKNEELSRAKIAIIRGQDEYKLALMSMSLGTVPCVPVTISEALLPSNVALKYTNLAVAKQMAQDLAQNDATYASLSQPLLTYVQEKHTIATFVASLTKIVEEIQKRGKYVG